jgi:hypothetical protein
MGNLFRFFSLTTGTQICLLANQLLLLPLQLRFWGQEQAATWFTLLAIANLATFGDLGLRNVGHDALLRATQAADGNAIRAFRSLWAIVRLLFLATASLVVMAQYFLPMQGAQGLWPVLLITSVAIDGFIIVRGIWLDSLGHFNRVEGIFLSLLVARLCLSLPSVAIFHASPETLSWMLLATAVVGLALQVRFVPSSDLLRLTAGGFDRAMLKYLRLVPAALTEPLANWVRLSLPVLILSGIAGPAFVATFVAVRAIFGLGRQIINQLARYASVHYIHALDGARERAFLVVRRSILACTMISFMVSAAVLCDHGRLIGLWLNGSSPAVLVPVSLSFAMGACAYGYQVIAGILIRQGRINLVASCQVIYLGYSALAAAVALIVNSIPAYLILLASQEVLIAVLFFFTLERRFLSISSAALAISIITLCGLAAFVGWQPELFGINSGRAWIYSTLVGGGACLAVGGTLAALGVILGHRTPKTQPATGHRRRITTKSDRESSRHASAKT